jgi:DNA topoisomerase VI subunit A
MDQTVTPLLPMRCEVRILERRVPADASTVITNIESIIKQILRCFQREECPILVRESADGRTTVKVDFRNPWSRQYFLTMLRALEKAYRLVSQGQTVTTRDLYYEDIGTWGSQNRLNGVLSNVCRLLQVIS